MQTDSLLTDVAIDSGVVDATTLINVLYDTKRSLNSQRINASIEMNVASEATTASKAQYMRIAVHTNKTVTDRSDVFTMLAVPVRVEAKRSDGNIALRRLITVETSCLIELVVESSVITSC